MGRRGFLALLVAVTLGMGCNGPHTQTGHQRGYGSHLLLWAPLKSSLDATHAIGDKRGLVDPKGSRVSFEDDGTRTGARFARDSCVYYGVKDNFDRSEGTIMLWFKPDWDADFKDTLGRILWDLRIEHGSVVPDDPSQRWGLVYSFPRKMKDGRRVKSEFGRWRFCIATDRNRYIIGTQEERKNQRTRQAVFGTIKHFRDRPWMHLAVTWAPAVATLWVDGQLDAHSELPEGLPDRPLPDRMQLGAIPSWINAGAEGVLADFRIYGKALDQAQILDAAGLTRKK